MRNLAVALFLAAAGVVQVANAEAQHRKTLSVTAPLPPVVQIDSNRLAEGGGHPLLRTIAALAGSAGGFAIGQAQTDTEPDDIVVPMAAAVAGGAIGTMLFSNANPFQVIAGSALSALPAAALATYLVGVTEDHEQEDHLPLVAFSIPHGLLTAAFGKNR